MRATVPGGWGTSVSIRSFLQNLAMPAVSILYGLLFFYAGWMVSGVASQVRVKMPPSQPEKGAPARADTDSTRLAASRAVEEELRWRHGVFPHWNRFSARQENAA